jgi:hypothetical protein
MITFNRKKLKFFILVLFFLVLGLLVVYLIQESGILLGSKKIEKSGDLIYQREQWSALMDEKGVDAAYAIFKDEYQNELFSVQHVMAHIIGELIYEKKGLEGLTICDNTFAFGCYHSFFGRALAENGVGVIVDLDTECVKRYGPLGTGCQHGIGHGLMEYFGHNYDGLLQALDNCKFTTQEVLLAGCTSGVFMEFNFPTVVSDKEGLTDIRELDSQNYEYPCNKIPDIYSQSCYYEIPDWWIRTPSINNDFTKAGSYCQGIEDYKNRISCYLGIGHIAAPNSNYVVEETLKKCNSIVTREGKIECMAGASWGFLANPQYSHLAPILCEGLSKEDTLHCNFSADIIERYKKDKDN